MLKAIGETSKQPAPRPQRGWVRACYDVLKDLNGLSTTADIKELLPLVMTNEQMIPFKKLYSVLKGGVYRGYFVESGGKFKIAPFSYYQARQTDLRQKGVQRVSRKNVSIEDYQLPDNPRLPRIFWIMLGFLLGFVSNWIMAHVQISFT